MKVLALIVAAAALANPILAFPTDSSPSTPLDPSSTTPISSLIPLEPLPSPTTSPNPAKPSNILGPVLCTTNPLASPTREDCLAAIRHLPKPLLEGQPQVCILIYATRYTLAQFGSCRIEAYSSYGNAACLDRRSVIKAAKAVSRTCKLNGKVEGGAQINSSRSRKGAFQGVRLLPVEEPETPVVVADAVAEDGQVAGEVEVVEEVDDGLEGDEE